MSRVDLSILVDTSNVACRLPEFLQSVVQTVSEILESAEVGRICALTFDNTPTVRSNWVEADKFDANCLESAQGGMCNVHLALREAASLFRGSDAEQWLIIVFMATNATDSPNLSILPDGADEDICKAEKCLFVKSGSYIKSPEGFSVSSLHTYGLGNVDDLRNAVNYIVNLSAEQNHPNADSDNSDNPDNLNDFNDFNHFNHPDDSDELKPPEYYNFD